MTWLADLAATQPVAYALLVLGAVAVAGLSAGAVTGRGIRLGSAAVLFAGLVAGELGASLDPRMLDFVREFGLVLFVFTIGLQLGPGFFASLHAQGLALNALAVAIVLLGALLTIALPLVAGIDPLVALGLFSGATTNTPSLGAVQQVLATLPDLSADRAALPSLAYAVSYPAGIVGIISTIVLLRVLFRVDLAAELERFRASRDRHVAPLVRRSLVIENPDLDGLRIAECPGRRETRVIVSRIRHAGQPEVRTATEETRLHVGDVVLAVGTTTDLDQFQRIVGRAAAEDRLDFPGPVVSRRAGAAQARPGGGTARGRDPARTTRPPGALVWHMPASVNLAFRELGITLFLACVGLSAGSVFFETVLTP